MQDTKPNRAQRRAAQSNGKPKFITPRFGSKRLPAQLYPLPRPQIAAPSRATRFDGIT